MKNRFSSHWIASTQPRKQRKYRYNAPLHVRGAFLGANLSKDLRTKYGTRSLRLRTGDEVKIMRGQYNGKTGKVERVDSIHSRVYVTGVDFAKRDGSRKLYPLQPSNLQITKLTDDKFRLPGAAAAKPVKSATPVKAKTTKSTETKKSTTVKA